MEYEIFYNGMEFKGDTLNEIIEQMEVDGCNNFDIVEALKESEY